MTTASRPAWADQLDATDRPIPDGDSDRGGDGRGWLPLSYLTRGPGYESDTQWMHDVATGYPRPQVRRWHNLVRAGERTLAAGPARRFASGIGWHLPELLAAGGFLLVGWVLGWLGLAWWPPLILAAGALLAIGIQVGWRRLSNTAVRRDQAPDPMPRDGGLDDEPAVDADVEAAP